MWCLSAQFFAVPKGMNKFGKFNLWAIGFYCLLTMPVASQDCGGTVACEISGPNGGTYYVSEPKVQATNWTRMKLFIFFHGHNGSGAAIMRNKRLSKSLEEAGYILVAPDGPQFTFGGRSTRGWAARPEGESPRGQRDDIKFVENVLADLSTKYDVDLDSTLVSGFSSGGSMAWYFSCYSSAPLAGVVAVAGGLRRPLPLGGTPRGDGSVAKTCPGGPRKLVHIHGFSDRQVPLEGRGIRSWHQGDVFEGLAVQRHTNQCQSRPDKVTSKGGYWCRQWTRCGSKTPIRFCLHAGGHGLPQNWLPDSLIWLEDN